MTLSRHNLTARAATQRVARLHRAGFTLLELIAAMSMVVILAMSLYASLRTAFRAQTSAEAAIEPVRTAELSMEFLRQDLQNALPPTGILAGAFTGSDGKDDRGRESDSVFFYSTAASRDHLSGNGDIRKIELVVSSDSDGNRVLVRRTTRNLLSQVLVDPDEEVLCRGVAGFSLRFFDGAEWLDSWDSTTVENILPMAVEVVLELDRDPAGSQPQTFRYTRVCALPCASLPLGEFPLTP